MATCDISNFYLGTPMERFEYMNIPFKDIPQIIIDQYELQPLVHNGMVLVEIRKGMYGLPQAGDGFRRACIRARDARTASSMEDRYGILTLVGNHCTVSVMRVDLVSLMYTV